MQGSYEGVQSSCEGIHKMKIIPKLGECTTLSVTVIGRVYNSLECYNNWEKNFTIMHSSCEGVNSSCEGMLNNCEGMHSSCEGIEQ